MKAYLSLLFMTFLAYGANSFASHLDHNDGARNWAAAANVAYQLADLGEYWQRSGSGYLLSDAAKKLHRAASDLYYTLRDQARNEMRSLDHSDSPYKTVHQKLGLVAWRVVEFTDVAPRRAASRANYLYNELDRYLR